MPSWVLRAGGVPANIDLDFANSQYYGETLANALSVSRASTGYAQTAAGVLVPFANNVPRITDLGLLVEEGRTNLHLRSQEFDNAAWTKTAVTLTADDAVAPDGTQTADKILETNTTTSAILNALALTVVSASTYTITRYIKRNASVRWVRLLAGDSAAGNTARAWFDIENGVVGSTATTGSGWSVASTPQIESLSNGFYRIIFSVVTSGTSMIVQINSADADGSATRNSNASYWLWGAQAELGAFATSYIPTTTVAIARAADVISGSGRVLTGIGASVGSIEVELAAIPNGVVAPVYLITKNTSIETLLRIGSSTQITARVGGLQTASTTLGSGNYLGSSATATKSGVAWSGAGVSVVGNNGTVGTDATPFGATATAYIGSQNGATSFINTYMKRLVLWQSRLNDNDLKALTA